MIEYHAKASFTKTGNVISEARSEGGCDDNCATKSETMYLIGYKAYDKALTNKAKHVDVPYVRSKVTPKLVNNPCLKKIDWVDQRCFRGGDYQKYGSLGTIFADRFFRLSLRQVGKVAILLIS